MDEVKLPCGCVVSHEHGKHEDFQQWKGRNGTITVDLRDYNNQLRITLNNGFESFSTLLSSGESFEDIVFELDAFVQRAKRGLV